jgi:hypothetical protein
MYYKNVPHISIYICKNLSVKESKINCDNIQVGLQETLKMTMCTDHMGGVWLIEKEK